MVWRFARACSNSDGSTAATSNSTIDGPRAIPAEEVAAIAQSKGIAVEVVPDVEDAINRAISLATDDDVILVTGSFYVIGPARRALHAMGE